jgi:hypothetical protein
MSVPNPNLNLLRKVVATRLLLIQAQLSSVLQFGPDHDLPSIQDDARSALEVAERLLSFRKKSSNFPDYETL